MAIEYVPYMPVPIDGQALLDNFTRMRRVLRYRGSDDVLRSIDHGMPLYETERTETIGEPNSGNLVLRGECVSACAFLKKRIDAAEMEPIDLVYIDPPFASGANYAKQVYLRRNPKAAEQARNAERQLSNEELRSFEETMYGDIWDKERYLNWMYENLKAIKSVMSPTASIYVHLDYHIGAYVKILLDEVFGEANAQGEIVWKRSTAHSDNAGFANLHDTIYYYSAGDDFVFNTQYVPYTDDYIKSHYNHVDKDGRRYLDRDLSAKGLSGGGYTYAWKGKQGYWRCPESTMQRYESENRLYYTRNGTPRYKQYLDDMPGMPVQDIWTDINAVNSQAVERTNYATQKPVALLERIIKASSNEGMTVADFFGGSGTTAVAAAGLNRHFIHVDVGVNSIQIARQRLRELPGTSFDLYEIHDGVALYRNPAQTMAKLKGMIPGLADEPSLSDFWAGAFHTAQEGMVPVCLPNLMDSSTKLLDDGTLLRIINEELPDLPEGTSKVVLFYVDVVDLDSLKAFANENNDTAITLELRDLKPLLSGAVSEDDFAYTITRDGDNLLDTYRVTITEFSSDRLEQKINEYNMKGFAGKKSSSFKPIALSNGELELVELVSLDCTAKDGPWHADAEIFIDQTGAVVKNGEPTSDSWDGSICSERTPLRIKVRSIAGDETIKAVA